MNKRIKTILFLTVMLLRMAVFSSIALANGEPTPTPKPTATPSPTPAPATKTLTPDGSLTLVDNISGTQSGDKQFITVITKNGSYFYIIIDHAAGTDNVYFLNKVDEADLMAVLEENGYEIPPTPTPMTTPRPIVEEVEQNPQEEKNNSSPLLIGMIVLGAAGAYLILKKKKAPPKPTPQMEEYDYDYDDEEEFNDEYEDEDEEDCRPAPNRSRAMNRATQKKGWDGML